MPKDTLWIERAWSRGGAESGWIESQWTRVGDFRMHARVSVSPARHQSLPVVLVHGIGITSRYWVPTSILLAPWFRNYAPDFPGFGLSDKPRADLRVPQFADWLAAWVRARRLRNVALVGNSFGCQIVADCAVRYPELVSCTVHIGPTTDPHGRTVREQVRRWQKNNPGEPFTHKLVSYRDYWDCGIPRVLAAFGSQLEDRIERKLPHIKVPSLIVRGSNDPIVPQRWAEEAARLLPQGRLAVVPGAFHTVNFSSPLELIRVMVPFLAEVHGSLRSREEAA